MEDTIEICCGCGKLPRPIDYLNELFLCSRCGNQSTKQVRSENYESEVKKLDDLFHKKIIETKIAFVKEEPIQSFKKPTIKTKKTKSTKPKKVNVLKNKKKINKSQKRHIVSNNKKPSKKINKK